MVSLHRYPVKSLLGESVDALDIDSRGCAGDRLWSVRTPAEKIGSGKSTRRFEAVMGLLDLRAETRPDGSVAIRFPDGSALLVTDAAAASRVSDLVGRPVTLARESDASHFDDGPVSLLGTASLAGLVDLTGEGVDPARFRANVLLATAHPLTEDAWLGRTLRIGTAHLQVTMLSPRCVMVNMATADLPAQPGNLAAIGRYNDARLGVIASVIAPGRITVGDVVEVL